ncbi:hypothetical protein ACFSGI_16435 [Paenibacillus nicotianae]|uniref:Tape measure domain-containing protein n=1 Tax=Paenibacillus nicotianae TaxID=1526551 RepID=A0ABW4UYI0_9BACL
MGDINNIVNKFSSTLKSASLSASNIVIKNYNKAQQTFFGTLLKYESKSFNDYYMNGAIRGYVNMSQKISEVIAKQKSLNDNVSEGSKKASLLGSAFQSIGNELNKKAIALFEVLIKPDFSQAKAAIVSAAEDQSTKQVFIARSGNPEVGGAMFEQFKQDAINSGANVKEALKGAQIFMSGAENTDQIRELNNMTVRLKKLSGAGQSESEIANVIYGGMQGRTAPLTAFNIPATEDESNKLLELGKSGNVDGYISAMNEIMNKRGMTEEALKTMMDAPTERWGTLMTNFNMTMIDIGSGALAALLPLLDTLNTAFQAGTFQPFFDMLTTGLASMAADFVWLITMLPAAWQTVVNSISILGLVLYNVLNIIIGMIPFILGLAVVWAILNAGMILGAISAMQFAIAQRLAAIATNIVTIAQRIFNFVMAANPIGFVIALIFGLITMFIALASVSGGVKEVLSNAFGFIMDCAENAVNFILAVINAGIKGINTVSGFFADLLGIESKEIPLIEATADFSGIKKSGQNFIKDFSMDKLTDSLSLDNLLGSSPKITKDTSAASQFKQELPKGTGATMPSAGMPSTSSAMPAMSSPTMPATVDNVNNVNNVGNIEGTVDISSEDLKMMRDLAELQAIQNFVSLTPTVQVTTGDINSGADLDTIVGHIGRKLEEEFVSTAQGVYI